MPSNPPPSPLRLQEKNVPGIKVTNSHKHLLQRVQIYRNGQCVAQLHECLLHLLLYRLLYLNLKLSSAYSVPILATSVRLLVQYVMYLLELKGERSEGLFYCLMLSALLSSMSDLSSLNLSLVSFSLHGGENLQVSNISLLSLITLDTDFIFSIYSSLLDSL